MSRSRERLTLTALGLAVVVAACGNSDLGIDVQKLQADLAFGVRDLTTDAPPANFDQPQPMVEETPAPTKAPGQFLQPQVADAECPDAAINEFPDAPAAEELHDPPEEGTYLWKVGKEGRRFFERRSIRKVEASSETDFTYETVQPDGTGGLTVTQWSVSSGGVSQSVGGGSGTTRTRYGTPDAGLALVRVDRYGPTGTLEGTFEPASSVLYFPLPLAQGDVFSSLGMDLTSGQSLEHTGKVIRRELVDACGEVVEGWLVEAEQVFRGADGERTRTYDYIVGLDQGAILLSEQIQQAGGADTAVTTYEIGQIVPDPLQEGLPD